MTTRHPSRPGRKPYPSMWGPGYGPGWFILIPIFWILLIGFFIFFSRRMYWRHRIQSEPMGAEGVLARALCPR